MTQQEMDSFAAAVEDFLSEKFPELAPGGYNLGLVNWHRNKKDKERQEFDLKQTINKLEQQGYEVTKKPPTIGSANSWCAMAFTQYGHGKEC